LTLSSVAVAFLFGILIAISSSGGVPNIITAWGSPDHGVCNSSIDMSKILTFRKSYKVAMVCGLTDPTKDKLDDETITVSGPYTIIPGGIQIVAPLRPAMAEKIKAIQQAALAAAQANRPFALDLQVWYDPIIIPNNVSPAKISKLSDVLSLGGKILRPQYFT